MRGLPNAERVAHAVGEFLESLPPLRGGAGGEVPYEDQAWLILRALSNRITMVIMPSSDKSSRAKR
jgi:hypothetical protein